MRTLSEDYTHTMTIPEMGISVRALPEGIGTLATHDADLRRIRGITAAVPGDVEIGPRSSLK